MFTALHMIILFVKLTYVGLLLCRDTTGITHQEDPAVSQQHGQFWVGTGLMPASTKANGPDDINWLGGAAGALASSPSDASPEEAPRKSDLETAKLLGKRIAEVAAKFKGK